MTFKHGAIPTEYKGVRFRSRTEARWAAFFDEVGWSWQYEPYDLSGWIPDFILNFENPLLVEVKPASNPVELFEQARRLDRSQARSFDGELLLLGSAPMDMGRFRPWHFPESVPVEEEGSWEIRWLAAHCDHYINPDVHSTPRPAIGLLRDVEGFWIPSCQRQCFECGDIDLRTVHEDPRCRHDRRESAPVSKVVMNALFARAQNVTQWKGKK